MQGAQNLGSEWGLLGWYAAATKVKRNAADGLFAKPSMLEGFLGEEEDRLL